MESIFVCGGDLRSGYIAGYFEERGYRVETYGHKKENEKLKNAANCDIVVLGLPALKGGFVNMPLSDIELSFGELASVLKKGTAAFGGRFSDTDKKEAHSLGLTVFDYSEDEIFQTENALYTAEGALSAIIGGTDISLCGMKILITGGGRISKALCALLANAPCKTDVYARSALQRTFFEMRGHAVTDRLEDLSAYDVIVNTVPADILGENVIKTARRGALVVDLSARPGYVDVLLCQKYSLAHLYLPGIPLKSAPRSAGIAAARAVERMYRYRE